LPIPTAVTDYCARAQSVDNMAFAHRCVRVHATHMPPSPAGETWDGGREDITRRLAAPSVDISMSILPEVGNSARCALADARDFYLKLPLLRDKQPHIMEDDQQPSTGGNSLQQYAYR